jgi:very-short-patch-repair endonuclease
MLSGPVETIRRARRLRRSMSLPEVLLWQELRKRPEGLKFRRQQAADACVTDFYCHAARLVVEVDGEAHNRGNAPEWDAERNANLARQGIGTLRIAARDVLDNLEDTVSYIGLRASERIGDPPPSGEGNRRSRWRGANNSRDSGCALPRASSCTAPPSPAQGRGWSPSPQGEDR